MHIRRHSGIDTFLLPNLMSYHPSSTTLGKWQWQLVQNPACPTTGCQGEEAGMEEKRIFYGVSKDGDVIPLSNPFSFYLNDKFNILFSISFYNNRKNYIINDLNQDGAIKVDDGIIIEDKNILEELCKYVCPNHDNDCYFSCVTESRKDIICLFLFVVNNTEVEWNLAAYWCENKKKTFYTLINDRSINSVKHIEDLDIECISYENKTWNIHNHPQNAYASGYYEASHGDGGDKNIMDLTHDIQSSLNKKLSPHYIYFEPKKTVFYYDENTKSKYIKKIKSYEDFSFLR